MNDYGDFSGCPEGKCEVSALSNVTPRYLKLSTISVVWL